MIVKLVERNGNKTKITVEIEKDLMEQGANKAYLKARKSIQLPGFRKGKAPRKLIESIYGTHVFYEDGLEEIFTQVYDFAVVEQKIDAVGQPSLLSMDIADDGTTTIILETEVYPEVTLGQYKGLEVEKAEAAVTDAEVEAELDQMAKNVAGTETVDRAAQMGDTANIDFEGFENGVPFEGGKGEAYDLVLGSNSFIPGFEEQIVGMVAGEEKDIDVTFPEGYHADELAGKPVVFHVKLNKVTVELIPEKDDEFAKDVSEFDTLEELKADIKAKKLEQREKSIQSAFENAAVELASANATVDMPNALVENALDYQMNNFAYQLQANGISIEKYAAMMGGDLTTMRATLRPSAEKQAKTDVVLDAIVKAEGLEVTEEEIEAEYKNLSETYQMDLERVKETVTSESIQKDLLVRKAVKLIADAAIAVAPKAEAAAEVETEEAASEE